MKRFSILCCLVLLLNVLCPMVHVHAETVATPTDLCDHERHYDESGHYCSKCGNESEKAEHTLETKCVDESGHYDVCTVCGYTSEVSAHWQSCSNPGVCKGCGYEGEIKRTAHKKKKVWVADGEAGCYSACSGCGRKEGETLEHEASCLDTTHCYYCGYEGEIEHVFHNGEREAIDDQTCGYVCSDCGTQVRSIHRSTCEDPTHCKYCGYEGFIQFKDEHIGGKWVYDEEGHYYECPICGIFDKGKHFGSCSDSTHCAYCGYEGEFNDSEHMWLYFDHDEESHWFTCTECKKVITEAHDWGEPVVVDATETTDGSKTYTCVCGATKVETIPATGTQCKHEEVVWKFYSVNGCYPACASCGEQLDMVYSHGAWCTDKNHCMNCGYEGETYYVYHRDPEITHDEVYHYTECSACGETEKAEHYAICSDETHCVYCGVEGEFDVVHIAGIDCVEYDEDSHWFTCIECGEDIKQEHFWDEVTIVEATETTDGSKTYTCPCGKTKVEVIPATGITECPHEEVTWVSDGAKGCHAVCSQCGKVGETSAHEANCADMTHCDSCGYEGEIQYAYHPDGHWVYDEVSHYFECPNCGIMDEGEHFAICGDLTHCGYCGMEGTFDRVEHIADIDLVEHDADWHWFTCTECGKDIKEAHEWSEPVIVKATETTDGSKTYTCLCGETKVEIIPATGTTPCKHEITWVADGANGCYPVCALCDMVDDVFTHEASCTDTTHCLYCGYEGEISSIAHDGECAPINEKSCGYQCNACGEQIRHGHWAYCDDPTVCIYCGYEGEIKKLSHLEGVCSPIDEKNCGYVCSTCGEQVIRYHWANCDDPTHCIYCGYEGSIHNIMHPEGYWVYDEIGHYQMCPVCNTITFDRAHYGTCVDPTHCGDCGIAGEFNDGEHMWEGIEHNADWHWYTCTDCGEFIKEGHDWGEPVVANGSKTYTCVDCGEVKVVTAGHTHTLGACVPTGSGAHAQTCTECGNTIATRCTLVETKLGNLDASACIYCGYITWNLDDAASGKQESKAVESATFELVDETGAAVESNNLSLVVYESKPEATIVLDSGVNAIVKKALTITVLEDNAPVKLANTVKLSIPMEDDLTGLKLLVVDENGELIEIEYEVIDGVMVFETNILGIFMLVQEI